MFWQNHQSGCDYSFSLDSRAFVSVCYQKEAKLECLQTEVEVDSDNGYFKILLKLDKNVR